MPWPPSSSRSSPPPTEVPRKIRTPDSQLELLQARLAAVGVGRRDFLKVAAGLAAMGAAGFATRPASAAPRLAPGGGLGRGGGHFRKGAAGPAAMGAAGFAARPASAAPKLAPGEKLAKEQALRFGGGG